MTFSVIEPRLDTKRGPIALHNHDHELLFDTSVATDVIHLACDSGAEVKKTGFKDGVLELEFSEAATEGGHVVTGALLY